MDSTALMLDLESDLDGFQIIEPELTDLVSLKGLPPIPEHLLQKRHAPVRVLLAEDDVDTRAILTYLLEKLGIEVTQAEDGELALEYGMAAQFFVNQFDLILMDLQLPDIDGYSVVWELRHMGYSGPIAALTGRPMDADLDVYKEAGCDFFLVKSEVQDKLSKVIACCLQ